MLVKVKLVLTMMVESDNVPRAFDDALSMVALPDCEVTGNATRVERHSGYGRQGGRRPYKAGAVKNRSDRTCYQLIERERAARKLPAVKP